jgi:hypothetical protein
VNFQIQDFELDKYRRTRDFLGLRKEGILIIDTKIESKHCVTRKTGDWNSDGVPWSISPQWSDV